MVAERRGEGRVKKKENNEERRKGGEAVRKGEG